MMRKRVKIVWFQVLVGLILFINNGRSLPDKVQLGGLFDDEDENKRIAFSKAIERVERDKTILPKSTLLAAIEKIPRHDIFYATKKVCDLLKTGVAGVFGPQSSQASAHIQSISDAMEIPHIEARWNHQMKHDSYSINLYPHHACLSKAYSDIVKYWRWMRLTIFYEDNEGLIRLQELLKTPLNDKFQITVRQIQGEDYRSLLKETRERGEFHIVMDCSIKKIEEILRQANLIGMMTGYYHYLITSLDLHTIDLDEFRYSGANITAFRLLNLARPEWNNIIYDWTGKENYEVSNELTVPSLKMIGSNFTTETALIYDAVYVFAHALHTLDMSNQVNISALSCSRETSWKHGNSLVNYMKLVEIDGLTGPIRFDQKGFRSNFTLDIIELSTNGLEKTGTWNNFTGINMTRNYTEHFRDIAETLQNKTLIVTTILERPYAWKKPDWQNRTGNDRYEGFCVDLLEKISEVVGFNYSIQPVKDGKYGAPNAKKEWNGMVRELIDRKADLAVAPLTITFIREEVIDFTKPFMNLGISILFKKPEKKNPGLFSFLSPLSIEVWIYMVTAYLGVSLTLFILARFSPYEWYNPHPCNRESDIIENQFSILNSLWFTIGSLMQQGSDLAPKAMSTRLVSGIWWFFALIMISSYTANLAAFLTVERMVSPIGSAEDLAKQTAIQYGSLAAGSTTTFFRESKMPTYQRMWNYMDLAEPSVFVNSTAEGISRVKLGNYAYLMESATIDYIIQRDCELTQIGGLLDNKGFGIGTPQNSPYRDLMSTAILKLQESSDIHLLKDKWYKQMYVTEKCDTDDKPKGKANELGLANVGGCFVILLGGLGMSVITAIFEFIWKARKHADVEKDSLCSQISREFQFAVRCGGSSKRPMKRRRRMANAVDNALTLVPLTGMNVKHTISTKDMFA